MEKSFLVLFSKKNCLPFSNPEVPLKQLRKARLLTCMVLAAWTPARAAGLPDILRDYDVWRNAADPIGAGQRGDLAAAARWPDDTPASVAARTATLAGLRQRLDAVAPATLTGEDALNRTLLAWRMDTDLAAAKFDEERIPFSSDQGFFTIPSGTAENTQLHSAAEARAWIGRLRALPAFYATETANLRRGLQTGFVLPQAIAAHQAVAAQALADTPPAQDPLLAPLDTMPPAMPASDQAALRATAAQVIAADVKPAQRALADFYRTAYAPHARATIGAAALPDGRAYYAMLVRRETTTDLTPDQIFDIGKSEIARIRAAMDVQIKASGFTGSFAAFQAMLRHDPRFYVSSREALLEYASRLAKRVDGQLPRVIGRLPRLPYGVAPVPADIEEGYTSARYDEGSPEQGRAGELWINTSRLDQRPLYELPALVAHEGAPGHHIQIALAQELTGLPTFRRDSEITAFVEGWAVYSEQLVAEMGLYGTPYERFGMLSMEMWRACRLVMDVGIHWKGYSRDQALSCLRDNTALSETNMQNEVDRYIAWPGQALGYKIGELKIMELRHRAEAAMGAAFDERAFHDVVLDEGAMPLSVLETRVNDWIAARH
jgi:uncharacterized protein (DUF885 family)